MKFMTIRLRPKRAPYNSCLPDGLANAGRFFAPLARAQQSPGAHVCTDGTWGRWQTRLSGKLFWSGGNLQTA